MSFCSCARRPSILVGGRKVPIYCGVSVMVGISCRPKAQSTHVRFWSFHTHELPDRLGQLLCPFLIEWFCEAVVMIYTWANKLSVVPT